MCIRDRSKADNRLQELYIPIRAFSVILERIQETLPIVYGLEQFVDFITRSSFCALREDKQDHYDKTQDIITLLITRVNFSTTLIEDIRNPLSFLNKFKSDYKKQILNRLRDIEKAVEYMSWVIFPFEWIIGGLGKLEIPIPYPKIKIGVKW